MKKFLNKKINRYYIILSIFWILIGTVSGVFYNIQSLYIHGYLFNSGIVEEGSRTLSFGYSTGAMLIGGAGLIAVIIAGPIFGYFIDKYKNYKKILLTIIFSFSMVNFLIFTFITPNFMNKQTSLFFGLLFGVFVPLLGIHYGYRSVLDGYISVYSEKNNLKTGILRGFLTIGSGLSGFGTMYLIQHFIDQKEQAKYWIFFVAFGSLLLILFIYFLCFLPELHQKKAKVLSEEDKKNFFILKKNLFRSKKWWLGIVIFMILIGFYIGIDIFYFTIIPNAKVIDKNIIKDPLLIENPKILFEIKGYFDLIRGPASLISFIIASYFIKRYGVKKGILVSFGSAIIVGVVLFICMKIKFNKWIICIIPSIFISICAGFCVTSGFYFVKNQTKKEIRTVGFSTFNTFTYGLGGLIYGLLGNFCFDALGGSKFSRTGVQQQQGYLIFLVMSIMLIIGFYLTLFFFKNNKNKN